MLRDACFLLLEIIFMNRHGDLGRRPSQRISDRMRCPSAHFMLRKALPPLFTLQGLKVQFWRQAPPRNPGKFYWLDNVLVDPPIQSCLVDVPAYCSFTMPTPFRRSPTTLPHIRANKTKKIASSGQGRSGEIVAGRGRGRHAGGRRGQRCSGSRRG